MILTYMLVGLLWIENRLKGLSSTGSLQGYIVVVLNKLIGFFIGIGNNFEYGEQPRVRDSC